MHESSSGIVRFDLFITLGMSDVRILNDLIFLNYLTQDNNAYHYMASVPHDLSINSSATIFGKRLQLPAEFKTAEYWRQLISNAGDAHHPTETYTFLHYEKGKNKRFGFPTKTVLQFDLTLPLHFILILMSSAPCKCCTKSAPFQVEFHTDIPHQLRDYNL